MSKRYTYSRTITTPEGEETFTADQFDSFDEARNAVDRGITDRRLHFSERTKKDLPKDELSPVEEEKEEKTA